MKKIKVKWFNVVILSVIAASIIIIILLCFKTYKWKLDSNTLKEEINKINETVKPIEIEDTTKTEIIKPIEELKKDNPYFDYINMNMINVDFNELAKINQDVKGWIKVNGTNVNYPFVQSSDILLINLIIRLDGFSKIIAITKKINILFYMPTEEVIKQCLVL